MALTYQESAELMNDAAFRDRVKVACLKFADYITGETADVPAHNTRVRWAQQTMLTPDVSVNQVVPTTVMDAAVQADGAAITDANLQSAVENAVNKLL